MEILLVPFVGGMLLAGPLALIVAIVALRRINALKLSLGMGPFAPRETRPPANRSPQQDSTVAASTAAAMPAPVPVRVESPRPVKMPKPSVLPTRPKTPALNFEMILGGQWLTWVGILALFFGTTFFIAVDLGGSALSGAPQVLIGLAVAVAFKWIGHRLCRSNDNILGLGLLGGGLALSFLASYAAYGFHRILPLTFMMPVLLAVAVIGALQALRRNSLIIASLNLVGAILTPIILVNLSADSWLLDAMLPYLVAVNLGTVVMGLRRGWAGLPMGAFLSSLVLVSTWWAEQFRPDTLAFFSVFGSWAVFMVGPWLQQPGSRFWGFTRVSVLIVNGLGFALFCYSFFTGSGELVQGMALTLLAAVYFGTSHWVKSRRGADEATRLSYSLGATLAALAIPVFFDQAIVTLGWTFLAANLILVGLRSRDSWSRVCGLGVLGLSLFRVAMLDTLGFESRAWFLLNGQFLIGLVTLGVMGWVVWAYNRYADRLRPWELMIRTPLLLAAVSVLAWKLSLEVYWFFHHIPGQFTGPQALLMWSCQFLLWTGLGLGTIHFGHRFRLIALRQWGYLMTALALAGTLVQGFGWGGRLGEGSLPLTNPHFLQGLVLTLVLFVLYRRLDPKQAQAADSPVRPRWEVKLRLPLLLSAVAVLGFKLSLEVMMFFSRMVDWRTDRIQETILFSLFILWTGYGLAVVFAGLRQAHASLRRLGYGFVLLALAGTVILSFGEPMPLAAQYWPILNLPMIQGLILAFGLWALSRWLNPENRNAQPGEASWRTPLLIIAVLVVFGKVSLEIVTYFKLWARPAASTLLKSQLTLSVVWGLYSGAVIGIGFARRFKPFRTLGMSLLGMTVLKVFLFDMQSLERGYRIAAFIALGILLLGISMLYQRERRLRLAEELDPEAGQTD